MLVKSRLKSQETEAWKTDNAFLLRSVSIGCVWRGAGKSVSTPAGGGYELGGRSAGFHGGVLNMFKNPV